MKLFVRVIEAKNIPALDPNGFSDPYARLQLGKQRFKTKVVKKSLNPSWGEEFSFKVDDLKEELVISVLDEDRYFNDDFVGQIKVPVSQVFEAKDKSLGTVWYTLQPKNKKSKNKDCGEILLTISFSQSNPFFDLSPAGDPVMLPRKLADTPVEVLSRSLPQRAPSPMRSEEITSLKGEKSVLPILASRIAQLFNKNVDTAPTSSDEVSDTSELPESIDSIAMDQNSADHALPVGFQDIMRSMEIRDQGGELPSTLPGGVVIDQLYATAPGELNSMLFAPDSSFLKSLAELQGSTDLQSGPWKSDNNGESVKRTVSYIKAPSKLIRALKAIEEQTYLKADGNTFAVLSSVSTPDAPYGKTFKVEVLYCITPGPELPSGELSSRLEVSWRVNFLQNSMLKSMIEGGTRQGIKESFEQYKTLVSQKVKPLDLKDTGSERDQLLATLQVDNQSTWKLAVQYFGNFTVISTIFMGLYVLVHIWLAMPAKIQGLEFDGLDLPDSLGEFIVSGLLVLQGKRVLELLSRFMQARVQKGSDHGIKAQGDGWLLTVALIEGSNLAAVDTSGFSDPYVVFSCNGKTRTSSIKFQKCEPLWNEIFEFDAMDEPPSVLNIEVFDFDGPFDEPTSLGSAEINFLRSNISELSDIWIPLRGMLAQACQSKLHVRIFLNNTRGGSVVKDYIARMEKEVGKKIRLRSPQANSAFQKLFKLPSEEFLINDFACHLKRKMPLQGRLFLSARIIGFHADLFGHKTKFFFLWEDIEDIKVIPPTLSSMGSPIIVMTLRPGRGLDSEHGAKTRDPEGRLKYHFHSFVSFNVAQRTIMALWRARALTPEQKVKIVEEEADSSSVHTVEDEAIANNFSAAGEDLGPKTLQAAEDESEAKRLHSEESGSFLGVEDVKMSVVYSCNLPVSASFLIELFKNSEVDRRVMQNTGCLNYSPTTWESEKQNVYQRQLYYKFDKGVSPYGGEVTSTQQISHLVVKNIWLIEEVMTLHGVPLGDFFAVHLRFQVEDLPSKSSGCSVQVYYGVAWLKYTKHQKRITKNILSSLQKRLKVMFGELEKEYVSGV